MYSMYQMTCMTRDITDREATSNQTQSAYDFQTKCCQHLASRRPADPIFTMTAKYLTYNELSKNSQSTYGYQSAMWTFLGNFLAFQCGGIGITQLINQ